MHTRISSLLPACALLAGLVAIAPSAALAQDATAPLVLTAARVSIAGTSNVDQFIASTNEVKLTRLALAPLVAGPDLLNAVVRPGSLDAFEIVVKAGTLTSPTKGLDENMWKALKTAQYPDIVFRMTRLDGQPGALRAIGTLTIAGVENEVTLDVMAAANASTVTVIGHVPLLMTDYGITPPAGVFGFMKANPAIMVTFDLVLAMPRTFTR